VGILPITTAVHGRHTDGFDAPLTRGSLLKAAAAVVAAPVAGSLLAACGSAARSNQLVVAAATTPPSLDWELVFGKEVYDHVFNLNDRLTRWKQIPAPDEEGGFDLVWQADNVQEITVPRMAEGWEVSNGGRTYTFSLRKDWPSHAGNEFTAADVKWTFERSFAVHGITSFYNTLATIERPEDVKVLDRYTIRIELAEPGPDLLLTMSEFWRAMVDSKLAKSHATSADPWAKRWMRHHDVGFGPQPWARSRLAGTQGASLPSRARPDHVQGGAGVVRTARRADARRRTGRSVLAARRHATGAEPR
jgi:peptide/nickel transport system substrate-binding protein